MNNLGVVQVLRDPELRKQHDATLDANLLQDTVVIYDTVSLTDLDLDAGMHVYACRCGGEYAMEASEETATELLLPCSSCSLHLRVMCDCARVNRCFDARAGHQSIREPRGGVVADVDGG